MKNRNTSGDTDIIPGVALIGKTITAMATLKIAMLTTFYPPYSFGGDAIGIERLVSALARDGHQVTVIHDKDAYYSLSDQKPADIPRPDNVSVIGLKSSFGLAANMFTHQLGRPVVHRRRLKEILKPGSFDIVWYHNISLIGGPSLLSYGDGLKIYEAHEHWLVCPTHVLWRNNRELCDARQCIRCAFSYRRPPQLWRYSEYLARQCMHVNMFIAKSEFSRAKHKEFGFPRDMEVIPYFLPDGQNRQEHTDSSPHDRPYFLFVGRLEKIKGLDDVLPVFADYPDADLLILGTGEYEPELRQQAQGQSNIHFLGRLAPQELSNYYASAIGLIVPSVCYETFGIILIEAFRQGTPVIARDIGPFGEIVKQCGGGILFSDTPELRAAMQSLQQDPAHRQSMGRRARSGFESNWSENAVLNRYYAALRRAALDQGLSHVATALDRGGE